MLNFLRPSGRQVLSIAPDEAIAKVQAGEATLIDVRDISELKMTGLASGALHIPLATFRMQVDPSSPEVLAGLSTDKPVILYCASGGRSQMAAQLMMDLGYNEVYNLGGLHHWQMGGGTITH